MVPAVVLLIPAYGLADRFAGGGWPALDDRLPGRAAFWGALFCAALGFALGGAPLAAAALVWLIYRTPPWKLTGGAIDPDGAGEIAGTFVRHLIPAPGLALIAYWSGKDVLPPILGGVAYALGATALACALAARVRKLAGKTVISLDDDDPNAMVELARGCAYGALVVALEVWG